MKICVVGGTGNISTSIVSLLLAEGHEITIFNRALRNTPPDGVRVIQGDRNNREEFETKLTGETFDAAIDMMCFTAEDARSSLSAFPDVEQFVMCSTVATYGIDYDWLPVTEEHQLRPSTDYGRGKVAADDVFLEAYDRLGYPVTIIKPSTTYGPQQGMTRQIAWDFSWIDRIRKGKPVVVCGDGNALHQHLHVDDAAKGFVGVLEKRHTIGQTYNLVDRGFITWADYHRTAMEVIGQEVELIGIPFADLQFADIPDFGICSDIFAHHTYYSAEKIFREVPEFQPEISLEEGMRMVIEQMDRDGRIPDSDNLRWEDRIIQAQRSFRKNL